MIRTRPYREKTAAQTIRKATIEVLESRWLLAGGPRQMEYLDRGVVAIYQGVFGGQEQVYVGWRLLGDDPGNIDFDLYRSTNGGAAVLVNTGGPISTSTNYVDTGVNTSLSNAYFVRPRLGGVPQPQDDSEVFTLPAGVPANAYLSVPLNVPAPGVNSVGESYVYRINDGSVGDLDGDGQYEMIIKWEPSNSKDNSQAGHTGNVYLDAYKLDGTQMWRIDLGRNIRAGAHYTQFMVYDLDGDGRAELACKTAPGTKDGLGNNVIMGGDDPNADYRNSSGYILTGPEYLTIFDGLTGGALATTGYIVPRGTVSAWGDGYGNRVDRFLAGVAYLDGERPSLVMCRGYYTRTTLCAWDLAQRSAYQRWLFDSDIAGAQYTGQGNHNLSVADIDADGKDEIIYGSIVINDDGTGLPASGLSHGDALHVGDLDPNRPGVEVFGIHEGASPTRPGAAVYDPVTGALIWGQQYNTDVGRGLTADINPNFAGEEAWTNGGDLWNISNGSVISTTQPSHVNFAVWWDADPLRELLNGSNNDDYSSGSPTIYKWDWNANTSSALLTMSGTYMGNNTKATPVLSGDILGDWREEVVVRATDDSHLRIYVSTAAATTRLYTLMHDTQYREAIAWQNVAYNQPPHPSFFLGDGMAAPPTPNIYLVQATHDPTPAAPTGMTATVGGLNQINLAWQASAGAVSYTLKRGLQNGGHYTTLATGLTGTSFIDNTVVNGTKYSYVVSAVDGTADESYNSTPASAKVPVPVAPAVFTYQAENASWGGNGTITLVSNSSSGFNGTGYINFPGSPNTTGFVEFTNVDGAAGGAKTIAFRYAQSGPISSGVPSLSGTLTVNGVPQAISFISTSSFGNWQIKTVSVTLTAGATNTIRLQVTGNDLANIDELQVLGIADTTAPTISSPSHVYQASPNTLSFTFSEAVNPSIALGDLIVTLLGPNSPIVPTAFLYDTNTRIATFTLPVSLADGNYRATFVSGGVIDASGNALSNTYSFDFFILAGDANHDRIVDVNDLVILANNWLGTGKDFAQGDFDGDGDVDAHDLGIMAIHWQQKLDPPPIPAPPVPTAAARRPGSRTPTRLIQQVAPSQASVL